jgi:hypothetical protein
MAGRHLILLFEAAKKGQRLFDAMQATKHDDPNSTIVTASNVKRAATTATSADIRVGP